MDRSAHYQELKVLAREKRQVYNVDTRKFGLREVRKIYKAEGIEIDKYPLSNKIKALYMCANDEFSVAVQPNLPNEPKLFALIHELKHHYRDQELLRSGFIGCGDFNRNDILEIGAEVFAAEFIYPEAESLEDIHISGINDWTPENIVKFKRNCKVKISYQFLCKRLNHLSFTAKDQFKGVKFQKLEYQLYGLPYHLRSKSA